MQANQRKSDSGRFVNAEAGERRRVYMEINQIAIRLVGDSMDVWLFGRANLTGSVITDR